MPYQIIKAGELPHQGLPKPTVFSGGSCRGRDWRLDFFHRFEQTDVTFINPRRDHFADTEMEPTAHAEQVAWEREAIDAADIAVFWLGAGLANQAARVEIGYTFGKGIPVIIGAEEGFLGMEHLTAFSGLVLSSSVDGLMNRFSSLLASYSAA